jgi:hypothetical protein
MKSLTIHVGLPKTATSTLRQQVFCDHPEVVYLGPGAGFPDADEAIKEVCFADGLNYEGERHADSMKKLLYCFSDDNRAGVVSYENISAPGRDRLMKATRLKALFPTARILITIRRPEDLMISMYFDRLRDFADQPHTAPSLTAWLEQEWRDNWRGRFLRLQFAKLLRTYRALFGRENVLPLFFEDIVHSKTEFANKLSGFLEVDREITRRLLTEKKSNARLTSLRYSEIRLYSRFPFLKPLERTRHILPSWAKTLVGRVAAKDEARTALPETWRQTVRDYASAENEELRAEFPEIQAYDYF